jgi:hypothetical protein
MLIEFLQIILECIAKLITFRKTLLATLAIATFLAIGCWLLCNYYSRLWNTRYRMTALHHFFCAIAAVVTFIGVLTYQSLEYISPITKLVVETWQVELEHDNTWSRQTFRTAYEEVKAQGKENFSNYPHPDEGGSVIPSSHDETRNKIALIYATAAVANFKDNHSYLSKILQANYEPSEQAIYQDHKAFFVQDSKQNNYPLDRAINLTAHLISDELLTQIPKVVTFVRITMVILFLVIQAIPFSLIGWAAYRDLKATV